MPRTAAGNRNGEGFSRIDDASAQWNIFKIKKQDALRLCVSVKNIGNSISVQFYINHTLNLQKFCSEDLLSNFEMSVYGGDSWAREAQHRKRKVDDLMIERIDSSIYKKLSSGKFACLVCPTNPVLDSPTMLSVRFLTTLIEFLMYQSKEENPQIISFCFFII